jgi:hypothetical protein
MDERSHGIDAAGRPRRMFQGAIDRAFNAHAKSCRLSENYFHAIKNT